MNPSGRQAARLPHPRRAAAVMALVLCVVALTACENRRFVTGWLPHWIPATSSQTFIDGSPVFEEMSPFRYATYDSPSKIVPIGKAGVFDTAMAEARAQGIPVMPSIVDEFPARGLAAILDDPVKRRAHVDAIVSLVETRGYDGIDLDYEKFAFSDGSSTWTSLKPNWIAFVEQLGDALHAKEKLLSVTVPPIWIDQWGNRRGYWSYAWDEIEPSIDRLRIMVYDWSVGRPGPIAPITWLRQVLSYAASVVPMGKVQIGIPAYGREWTAKTEGDCPTSIIPRTDSHTMREIPGIITETKSVPKRDATSGEMTFTYQQKILVPPDSTTTTIPTTTVAPAAINSAAEVNVSAVRLGECLVTREVWYPDATSWRVATTESLAAGATGMAVWALGYESPEAAQVMGDISTTIDGPSGTSPLGRLGRLRVTDDGRIRAIGWAFDPEGDLPIRVIVTVSSVTDPTRSPVVRTLLARRAKAALLTSHPGAGEFHGFRVKVQPPGDTGTFRVCLDASGRYAGPNDVQIACRNVTLP